MPFAAMPYLSVSCSAHSHARPLFAQSSEVSVGGDFAAGLVAQFLSWSRSSHALMYDPALPQMIHTLMKKVFINLVVEIRRLGGVVVYASQNKVIVDTRKTSLSAARQYERYLLKTLQSNELFEFLLFERTHRWHPLVHPATVLHACVLPLLLRWHHFRVSLSLVVTAS
jgi:uncharacterized protein DUF1744